MTRIRSLFVGLPLLLLPTAAWALDCEKISSGTAPISSHYVQKVLDRADGGLEYAREALENEDFFPFYLPAWARSIGGTMAKVIDSRQRLTGRVEDLNSTTACLRFDEILIECKMDETRRALDEQLERGSFYAIMQLQSLMTFLQERLAVLSTGSVDGSYADTSWEQKRLFDREEPEPLKEPLCPFHSDYTPARMTGYGCDVSVLQSIVSAAGDGALPFAEAEMQGLQKIQEEIDSFRGIIPLLQAATSGNTNQGERHYLMAIATDSSGTLFGRTGAEAEQFANASFPPSIVELTEEGFSPTLSPQAAAAIGQIDWDDAAALFDIAFSEANRNKGFPVLVAVVHSTNGSVNLTMSWLNPTSSSSDGTGHLTIFGCTEEIGACSGDDLLACGSDEFCAAKDKGFCVKNTSKPTIPKRSIRGPFSYPTDHLSLLTDFVQKRIDDGFSRTYPNDWIRTSDIAQTETGALADRERDSRLLGAGRAVTRLYFQSISGLQGRREGAVFAEATDSQLEIADSLSDMRASIGELSRLASQKQGVRSFVGELAYFLRRTCAFRPCQKSLEQVIRISLQDECFPYTNGQFLKDTEENPRWKKCALAACIQVDDTDGEPLDLPDSCDEILP